MRDELSRTIAPSRALAAEILTLERALSDVVNQAYGLTRMGLSYGPRKPGTYEKS